MRPGYHYAFEGEGEATIDLEEPIQSYSLLSNMNLQSEFLIDDDVSFPVMGEPIAEEEIPEKYLFPSILVPNS